MQDLIKVARPISYVWFLMVSITPFGMVWYVSKHKHKEKAGTVGIVVERVEALWKHLYAFRAFRERMRAFSTLGRQGSIKPYGMVLYAMYVFKHKHK